MGIRDLGISLQDFIKYRIRERTALMVEHGHRFTVYTFELPYPAALAGLASHQLLVHAWEIICNWRNHEQMLIALT